YSGIGLNKIVIGAGINVALTCRNDPGSNSAPKPKRITNGKNPVPDTRFFGVAKFYLFELMAFGIHFKQSKIGLDVITKQRCFKLRAINKIDFNLIRISNYVIICNDKSVGSIN